MESNKSNNEEGMLYTQTVYKDDAPKKEPELLSSSMCKSMSEKESDVVPFKQAEITTIFKEPNIS
jgi:hypothetical protein